MRTPVCDPLAISSRCHLQGEASVALLSPGQNLPTESPSLGIDPQDAEAPRLLLDRDGVSSPWVWCGGTAASLAGCLQGSCLGAEKTFRQRAFRSLGPSWGSVGAPERQQLCRLSCSHKDPTRSPGSLSLGADCWVEVAPAVGDAPDHPRALSFRDALIV